MSIAAEVWTKPQPETFWIGRAELPEGLDAQERGGGLAGPHRILPQFPLPFC